MRSAGWLPRAAAEPHSVGDPGREGFGSSRRPARGQHRARPPPAGTPACPRAKVIDFSCLAGPAGDHEGRAACWPSPTWCPWTCPPWPAAAGYPGTRVIPARQLAAVPAGAQSSPAPGGSPTSMTCCRPRRGRCSPGWRCCRRRSALTDGSFPPALRSGHAACTGLKPRPADRRDRVRIWQTCVWQADLHDLDGQRGHAPARTRRWRTTRRARGAPSGPCSRGRLTSPRPGGTHDLVYAQRATIDLGPARPARGDHCSATRRKKPRLDTARPCCVMDEGTAQRGPRRSSCAASGPVGACGCAHRRLARRIASHPRLKPSPSDRASILGQPAQPGSARLAADVPRVYPRHRTPTRRHRTGPRHPHRDHHQRPRPAPPKP